MGLPTISDALESDLPAIKSLESTCKLSPWPEADYRKIITDRSEDLLLVAKENEQTIGFILMRLITIPGKVRSHDSSIRSLSGVTNEKKGLFEAEICNIAVDKSKRRHGIAAKLLQKARSRLMERGNYTIFLEVRESNRPAIGFYLANGFEKVGLRQGYYFSPIEDAWIMKLSADFKS